MDISETLTPNSDQLDACDLLAGPRTFTVTSVSKGNPDQPVEVTLAEFPRVWRPGKSMRRVLAACWSTDASAWAGRRVELYCDPTIMFGKDAVGGTRISRLSHIDGPKKIPLLVSRGKSAMFTVQPLPDAVPTSPAVAADKLAELTDTLRRKGIPEDKWLAGVNHYTDGAATSLEAITEAQAQTMMAELAQRPDVTPAEPEVDDTGGGEPLWPDVTEPGTG